MSLLSKERKHALQEVVENTTTPSPASNNLITHDQSQYNSSNNSVISFESGHNNNFLHNHGAASIVGGGSYLRFNHHQQQQQISSTSNGYEDYPFWEDNTSLISESYQHYHKTNNGKSKRNLSRDLNYDGMNNNNNSNAIQQAIVEKDQQFGWPSSSSQSSSEADMAAIEAMQDAIATQQSPSAGPGKRRLMGENTQAMKKQCINDNGNGGAILMNNSKSKTKSSPINPSLSKDPQSIAAKNRRERISERLKILQEMVPNGSKVDLVTMLEKAISYVKFLQLQVKVLATDEFWPTAGGKAPNLSQVREAIDAILASHRDRNSSSK